MRKLFLLLAASAAVLSAAPLKIAENGKALAGILVPANAKPVTKAAADELALYLRKMTGAEFTVGTASPHKVNFRIGFGDSSGFEINEYAIKTNGNNIDIYGKDSSAPFSWFAFYHDEPLQGSLRGVYEFLDMQGVIWPNPGIEYVPEKKVMTVGDLDIRRNIGFIALSGAASWNFFQNNRDAKEYAKTVDDNYKWLLRTGYHNVRFHLYGCHTEHYLGLHNDPAWIADPEHLLLNREGKRVRRYSCWTHPDLLKVWIRAVDGYFSGKSAEESGFKYTGRPPAGKYSKWPFPFVGKDEFMIDPMDSDGVNDGKCRCERCNRFRKENPCVDDTELLWDVIIKVAEYTLKKYPGKYITTLVYPPKMQIPKKKLPANIKVRICMTGPKVQLWGEKAFREEIGNVAAWYKITGNKSPLWVYHCISHGDSMPFLVETYPRAIARYAKELRGISSGMYMETRAWNKTFTAYNLDLYIMHRMMNDPSRDVEQELKKYFKASYGPAAAEGAAFFNELERLFADFWSKTVPPGRKACVSTPWGYRNYEVQRSLWTLTYTAENLQKLDNILKQMEKKTAGTVYAGQTALLRKYLLDEIIAERRRLFDTEDQRRALAFKVTAVKQTPSAADWQTAPVLELQSAERFSKAAVVPGSFRLLSDGVNLYCRAELTEPAPAKSKSTQRVNGSGDIWKDNCFELFFYSAGDKKLRQIVVNDLGFWSSGTMTRSVWKWQLLPGVKVRCQKNKNNWTAEITVPLVSIAPKGGEIRFNAARERNVKGYKQEFSTWSPLSKLGEWHNYHTFPTIFLK